MNPIRHLTTRDDICTFYTERKTNIAEMELKRTIREKGIYIIKITTLIYYLYLININNIDHYFLLHIIIF